MYLTKLKSAIVEGLRETFDDTYPNLDFRGLRVGIEYPLERQNYPSCWVNYDDRDSLEIAGINQVEYVLDSDRHAHEVTRWKFSGTVTLTAVALSSLERDNLYDELVRVYAFSRIEGNGTVFRTVIENNDFVGLVFNWDQLRPGGDAAAPGTPWGTDDEVIYEKSLSFDVEGEFVSDPSAGTLVALSTLLVTGISSDPVGSRQQIAVNEASQEAWNSGQWH